MVDFIKRDKNDIYSKPIMGFLFKNQKFLLTLKLIVLGLFLYALYFGFAHTGKDNTFTYALFWGIFWALFMVLTLPTFGRIFCGICPHGFMGQYITKFGLKKKMPKWMQNRFIGLLLLVIGWWAIYYMFPGVYRTPFGTAMMFTVMTLVSFVVYFIYKDMSYCKYICPIGVLTRAYSKLSFTWLGTYKTACNDCKTFECATACPQGLKPFTFDNRNSMTDCTLCMDCSSACEAVSFKYKKPSFSLFSKFQTLKAEVWAFILILASIPITMSFHHGIGRSSVANEMIWAKTAESLKHYVSFGSIDTIGLFAFLYAMLFTITAALVGMFIASKILQKDFSKVFYNLGYSYAPLFILGSIAHSLESFFTKGYKQIVEGFGYGFGFDIHVASLAQRGDGWLHIFGLLKWVAIIWAFIILYKRMKLINASKMRKIIAFAFASSLIIFFLSVNLYRGYILSKYPPAGGGHGGHSMHSGKMFQSVSKDKAIIVQSGKDKNSCSVCGMNLPKFYKTNHTATHNNESKQYCSIHCLTDEKEINKTALRDIKVVDVTSLKFIDAYSATYVVGSKKKATMSRVSKYAFANKADAYKFSKKFGGKIVNFEEASKVAMRDFGKKQTLKKNLPNDIVYINESNPMAKASKFSAGHMHGGGGRNRIPTKKVWPVFIDEAGGINCIDDIKAKLYVLDSNLTTSTLKQSRDRGCKSVTFKMPEIGYYNLFYYNQQVQDNTLYKTIAKYEYMRMSHGSDAVYDKEKMSAHSIKEIPFDILRIRDEDEGLFHRMYTGEKINLKVIMDSKPIENASVTFSTKSGWSQTLKTDKDGLVSFSLVKDYYPDWDKFDKRHESEFILDAKFTKNEDGEYENQKYSSIKYRATYTGSYYPEESGYSSYAYALVFTIVTILLTWLGVYWFRKRKEVPFKEVRFDEKD